MNELYTDVKVKTKPGTKTMNSGRCVCITKKNFQRPTLESEKFEDLYTKTAKEIAHYAGRTYKQPEDIIGAIETLTELVLVPPTMATIDQDPNDPLDKTMAGIYLLKEINLYLKHSDKYKNKQNKDVKSGSDIVGLLTFINDILFRYGSQCYPFKAVHNAMQVFYVIYQHDEVTLEKYMESFVNSIGM
eukprot:10020743-Ditylum_brightwellii.AAC.1